MLSATAGPATSRKPINVERGFVATSEIYEQLFAYGQAMGWMDKPFDFVLRNWLASREV